MAELTPELQALMEKRDHLLDGVQTPHRRRLIGHLDRRITQLYNEERDAREKAEKSDGQEVAGHALQEQKSAQE
jgi:hypothetical protein